MTEQEDRIQGQVHEIWDGTVPYFSAARYASQAQRLRVAERKYLGKLVKSWWGEPIRCIGVVSSGPGLIPYLVLEGRDIPCPTHNYEVVPE